MMVSSNLTHHIDIYRKYDNNGVANYGARQKTRKEFMYSVMCDWELTKPVEMIATDDGDAEPIKYIQGVKVTIPYIDDIRAEDFFIRDDDGIWYEVKNIIDSRKDKQIMVLYLSTYIQEEE